MDFHYGVPPRKPVIVREGREEDKDAIFSFCQNTFSWGDYVSDAWDTWMKDQQGRIFVADVAGVAIGMVHLLFLNKTEGWIEGVRVHPDFRRVGVASQLLEFCLQFAKSKGVSSCRLLTLENNLPARSLFTRLCWRKIAEFVNYEHLAYPAGLLGNVHIGREEDLPSIRSALAASKTFRVAAGLCPIMWRYHSLTSELLQQFTKQSTVTLAHDGLAIFVRESEKPPIVQTSYLEGSRRGVRELVDFLSSMYGDTGTKTLLHIIAPNEQRLTQTLEEIGFRPRSIHLIYERTLPPISPLD